jgi:uncharacterized protein
MNQSQSSPKKLRIAAVGDLHVQEHSYHPFKDLFMQINEQADVLLLAGDLTNTGIPKEAENLIYALSQCRIPVLGVLGNHDHTSNLVPELTEVLRAGKFKILEDERFILNDVGFAGVKGFCGGFDQHMLAYFGEEATKKFVTEAVNEALRLETSLKQLDTPKKVVVMHYSPVKETIASEPAEIHPFMGSTRFAEVIDRYDIAAVFHGHAHHGAVLGKTTKGTPVYNVSYDLLKKYRPDQPFMLIEV